MNEEVKEVERIADQIRRSYEGSAWHGPSLSETLSGITAEQASAKPIEGAHSIWELVLHIAFWENTVRKLLVKEKVKVTDEENFPNITDKSETAWQKAIAYATEVNMNLREAVQEASDEQLNELIKPSDERFTTYVTLHGTVQHTLYHTGQIVILKKALGL